MKLSVFSGRNKVKSLFLAMTILLGFVFIVAVISVYVSDLLMRGDACACVIPIPYLILILSSLGLFVGSLASYLLLMRVSAERRELDKSIIATLNFLSSEERKLIKVLIAEKGESAQARLEPKTGFHRVKVHRVIDRLVQKGVIEKKAVGKTNRIALHRELRDLFCKEK